MIQQIETPGDDLAPYIEITQKVAKRCDDGLERILRYYFENFSGALKALQEMGVDPVGCQGFWWSGHEKTFLVTFLHTRVRTSRIHLA